MGGVRGYELPTSDLFGGIVFENGPRRRTDFDVIIECKSGPPQRINKLHQLYMSLQFPLLFVFDQSGLHPELQLKPRDGKGRGKRVTMKAYYKYQLHPRVKEFGLLFRSGRLFQQYVVTVFCAIEQNRLHYIRKHQNDFRSNYLSCFYDAISKGDREGIAAGSKIMLPSTFTGGPWYMYSHYLDALAICRSLGKTQFLSPSHLRDAPQIDKYISAEIPDSVQDPKGYKLVMGLMRHGPYGAANLDASCMHEGSCNKNFPKKYNDKTFFDTNGHTQYRRRDTGVHVKKGESKLDNCNDVPNNCALCLAFEAHINVEYCGWSMLIKYLFKYISKGPDRILVKISNSKTSSFAPDKSTQIDEIQNYVDGRFIFPFEVVLIFRERDRLDIIVNLPEKKKTTLTEWFVYNNENTDGRHLTYLNFPSEFVWYPNAKQCQRRQIRTKKSLGRLTYVQTSSTSECYCVIRKGVDHQLKYGLSMVKKMLTYRAACEALGLLSDDKEWDITFQESAASATLHFIRGGKTLNGFGKSVKDFGLELPPQHLLKDLENKLLMEEKNYKRDLLREDAAQSVPKLNHEQKKIYDLIISAATIEQQELLFIYGHGGTKKTFLWKKIISSLRSQGKIMLEVASSGIASLLLPAGRTTHSRFKIPLELTDESLCHAKKSQLRNLLVETDLIIWGKAPMNDRRCFETLDRTLRDLMNAPDILFGGKTIVLGGDFRQTLSVKKGATTEELIVASIIESHLWWHFKICTLKENIRLLKSGLTNEERQRSEAFAKWLLDVGNGEIGEPDEENDQDSSWITIPPEYSVIPDETGLSQLIDFIYDDATLKRPTAGALQQKAIVWPKNQTADAVNAKFLSNVEGQSRIYLSNDEAILIGRETGETKLLYPMEYLNTITFPGFPPHELELKVGSPIMLVRNVNLSGGLCNGIRMIIRSLMSSIQPADIKGSLPRQKLKNDLSSLNSDATPFGDANTGQKYRRKVDIENLDGNILEFTMWDEVAKQFNKEEIEKLTPLVIIAVTSCHVTKYKDVQLAATPATHYYINPQTPEAEYVHTA
ncbi:DNA helicase [Tanacetum coccineum]|uniref:ATP-dependent DNA helicase n=1 Tax=Tanacetum coccineum TaxID=301880 RepID=A0ABQ5H5C0_9ASTR